MEVYHKKEYHREYFSDCLLGEYKGARGVKFANLKNPNVVEDVRRFIHERRRSNDFYTDMLDRLMIDYRESDTLENINVKEFLISRTCDYDTTVVSSDKTIYDTVKRDRVILGNIRIYRGVPVIISKINGEEESLKLVGSYFKNVMKTNPRIGSIRYFGNLYKLGKFGLIIGINGNADDSDYLDKLEDMNQLSSQLGNGVIRYSDFDLSNGDYAHILFSKSLRKIR